MTIGDQMVDVKKLRGAMVAAGFNQNTLAKELGMSKNTLCTKLKKGVFSNAEISQMVELLGISDPLSIFFQSVDTTARRAAKAEIKKRQHPQYSLELLEMLLRFHEITLTPVRCCDPESYENDPYRWMLMRRLIALKRCTVFNN